MSSDISPSLVNWMTSMMTMRLQVILEHIPVTQEQIQNYIVHTQVRQAACVLNIYLTLEHFSFHFAVCSCQTLQLKQQIILKKKSFLQNRVDM